MHITYEQLLTVVSWGIFSMDMKGSSVYGKKLKKIKKIDNAMYGGIYTGSPGRDIYFMLPYLSDQQMEEVSKKLSDKFLKNPPKGYANTAACIRFLYGQFEKQGILRSEEDFKRMKKEKSDWSFSRKFIKMLEKYLRVDNNYFGLSMIYEMEGHRLGDEAIIYRDKNKLERMEEIYNKCVLFADKCNGYKHMFSIYYWAAEYFDKFGNIFKSLEYSKRSIKNANKYYYKYFPKGEIYYSERLRQRIKYIRDNDTKQNWEHFYDRCCQGKKIKNIFRRMS